MTGDRSRPEARPRGEAAVGVPPLELYFTAGSLHALRSAVAAHAVAAGLPEARVPDVVTAAHELAANAVRHGAGHGRLRLQVVGRALACQVSDEGPGAGKRREAPEPARPMPWPAKHGHGLWMVRHLADQFAIDHGPAGTTATASFTVRAPR